MTQSPHFRLIHLHVHENFQNKSFFAVFWWGPTTIERKKSHYVMLIVVQGYQFPAEVLYQIWSIWKDRKLIFQKRNGAGGHPWGEIYRLKMITSLPWSRGITGPIVERHNTAREECKMKRDKSGWDGRERQGVKKNKRIHCVRLIVFEKITKMKNWWKKRRTFRDGVQRELGNGSAAMSSGTLQKAFYLDTRQPTEPGAECPHASVGNDSESFTFLHAPHTKKRSLF